MANNMKIKDTYIYFIYSEQQLKERQAIEKKMSRVFTPGTVVANGTKKLFTEISKSPNSRYPDSKIVAEGFKSKMIYIPIATN